MQLRNVLKFKNISEKPVPAEHLKKLILKRVLDRAKENPELQIDFDKVSLENVIFKQKKLNFNKINKKVLLYVNDRILDNDESLFILKRQVSRINPNFIVFYEILFKL